METAVTDESRPHARAPRVLFVDDSADERELFPLRFRDRFASYVAVGSAAEAVEELTRGETEIVFTDIALPDESGLDLVRRMRAMAPEIGGEVPAVAVTGLGGADDLDRAYKAGFSGYLVKPYDNVELLSLVDRVSPSVAALRALRARLVSQFERRREVRSRLLAQHESVLAQRAKRALRREGPSERDAARLECILASARAFARDHFGRPADEIEVATAKPGDGGATSWVVVAVAGQELLFVEVVDGPGVDLVASRLDA